MQYKVGQRVRARKTVSRNLGAAVSFVEFHRGQDGYIAGLVTYEHGGPVYLLVSRMDGSEGDWCEYALSTFRSSFRVLH